jgi:U3 small nucleolar RNA-associated protein 20
MALLRECPKANVQLSQDCLKLLNNLLKRHAAFTPTDAQFRFIISFAFGDLEGDHREEQRSTTFSLMRAVLARRPLLPEVYDMMRAVSSLVVRAGADEVRQLCAQALVQFLLDYPLGERRLQQHLEALAANLEYQHAAGRLSALGALRDVIARFPRDAVETHATFFFVPLVARLGADEDPACRRAAGEALTALLKRVAGTSAGGKLLALAVGWCVRPSGDGGGGVGDDPRLRRAAMQTLGLAITAAPADAARAVAAARPAVAAALAEHDPARGGDEDDDDETVRGWQTAYYALLFVEKAARSCPKSLSCAVPSSTSSDRGHEGPGDRFDNPSEMWRGAAALMSHRHQWVQQAASRVIGHYLAANGQDMALAAAAAAEANAGVAVTEEGPVRLEQVVRACVMVLEQGTGGGAVEIDPGLAEQTVKNLTFASVVLLQTAPSVQQHSEKKSDEDEDGDGDEDGDEDGEEDEDDDKEAGAGAGAAGGDNDSSRGGATTITTATAAAAAVDEKPPLPWLFRRMSKVGAGGVGAARAAALQWTANVATQLGTDGFTRAPAIAVNPHTLKP